MQERFPYLFTWRPKNIKSDFYILETINATKASEYAVFILQKKKKMPN